MHWPINLGSYQYCCSVLVSIPVPHGPLEICHLVLASQPVLGVNGTQGMPEYCMHTAVPFPALHWPYVALLEVSCHAGRGSLLRRMRPASSRSPPSKRYGPTHRLLLENTLSASERTIPLLQVPYVSHTGIGQQRRLCQRS